MKKFMNKAEHYVDEMLQGILVGNSDDLRVTDNDIRCIVRKNAGKKKKVALASGGGSGHLPLFMGYVGEGMLDGCSVGGVFQSPSAEQMYQVTKAIDSGMGVLYIYGNYSGDIINFEMAGEMADMQDDISVEHVLGMDDVASAPFAERHKRRGVAGIFYIYKIAGAMAESGASLAEVKEIALKTADAVRTIGVASSPCTIPEVGKPSFTLADDEMEIGMGIHGEPGIRRGKLKTADEIAEEMLNAVLADADVPAGSEVSVLVNGLGSTPLDELYIVYRKLNELLSGKKITIFHSFVGEFATSMEMAGFSVSLLKLDDQLKRWLSIPARTPFYTQFDLNREEGTL